MQLIININWFVVLMSGICLIHQCSSQELISPLAKRKFSNLLFKHAHACSQELGNGKMGDVMEFVTNPEASSPQKKCLLACIMAKVGLMDFDNKLNVRKLEKLTHELTDGNRKIVDIMRDIGYKCAQQYADDKCEAAYRYDTCMVTEIHRRKLKFSYKM